LRGTRHRTPSNSREIRSSVSTTDIARHVIGCRSSQETRVHNACRSRGGQYLPGPASASRSQTAPALDLPSGSVPKVSLAVFRTCRVTVGGVWPGWPGCARHDEWPGRVGRLAHDAPLERFRLIQQLLVLRARHPARRRRPPALGTSNLSLFKTPNPSSSVLKRARVDGNVPRSDDRGEAGNGRRRRRRCPPAFGATGTVDSGTKHHRQRGAASAAGKLAFQCWKCRVRFWIIRRDP